jgi:hypothetical protein
MAEIANEARRDLLELSARLDAIASRLGDGQAGDPVARDAAAQLGVEAGRLRRILDAISRRARDGDEDDNRTPDSDTRVEPPIDEVVDEMRRRR